MGGIGRRMLMKFAAFGGAASLTNAKEARAEATLLPGGWPNKRLLGLLKIAHPIIQAPMGFHTSPEMPAAVCEAGGLGSYPCAALTTTQVRDVVAKIRNQTAKPLNLNFFCHVTERDTALETAWLKRLESYYTELGVTPPAFPTAPLRPSFGAEMCDLVIELKAEVASFHFGLPDKSLIDRLKGAGCVILSSATTVAEARWLEDRGADAVIAQGVEAGGHRGMFLTANPHRKSVHSRSCRKLSMP